MKKNVVKRFTGCFMMIVMIAGLMTGTAAGYAAEKTGNVSVTLTTEAELTAEAEMTVGGYTSPKSPKLTKKLKKVFKKAFRNFVGSKVTPVAYLGKQTVAGTNYLYLCTIKAVVPDAKEYYCFVTVNKDLKGKCSIYEINNTEVETGINELPGGWFAASNVKVSKKVRKAMNKALKGLVGVDYKPVAVLSQQVVAGMNYCVLCESKVVYPGAQTEFSLVCLFSGLDGSAEIVDIKKLENAPEEDADKTL